MSLGVRKWSLPGWYPPVEQRLSAWFPSENAEPLARPRACSSEDLQLSFGCAYFNWSRTSPPATSRRLGCLAGFFSALSLPEPSSKSARQWSPNVPRSRLRVISRAQGGHDNGPCLRRCQAAIYQILCCFFRAGARYGAHGRTRLSSSACPIFRRFQLGRGPTVARASSRCFRPATRRRAPG
jgi:hypothetical protein